MTRRFPLLLLTGMAIILIALSMSRAPRPLLLWNASASVPIGLYRITVARTLRVGDLVVVTPPNELAMLLERGGYLPRGVPLLKSVLALSGQTVCRKDTHITVDGSAAGDAQHRDHRGQSLPVWQGCHVLTRDEVFLMNHMPDSFDGRYFGVLPTRSVIGHARPLWTHKERR